MLDYDHTLSAQRVAENGDLVAALVDHAQARADWMDHRVTSDQLRAAASRFERAFAARVDRLRQDREVTE